MIINCTKSWLNTTQFRPPFIGPSIFRSKSVIGDSPKAAKMKQDQKCSNTPFLDPLFPFLLTHMGVYQQVINVSPPHHSLPPQWNVCPSFPDGQFSPSIHLFCASNIRLIASSEFAIKVVFIFDLCNVMSQKIKTLFGRKFWTLMRNDELWFGAAPSSLFLLEFQKAH